jgi:hypothetical protein
MHDPESEGVRNAMARVMVTCPVMHLHLSAGVTVSSAEELHARDFVNMETPACPWCGRNHLWSSTDAFVEGRIPYAAHHGQAISSAA